MKPKSNPSYFQRDEPERRWAAPRAEGAEAPVATVTPPDVREQTDEYLRDLEATQHYPPIRETCGAEQ